jgi:hypothetical protein
MFWMPKMLSFLFLAPDIPKGLTYSTSQRHLLDVLRDLETSLGCSLW